MTQPTIVRFGHVNIIARDWRRLADFYCQVFGCAPTGPERDHHGNYFDRLTGIPDAHAQGVHLALPGLGDNPPTLEIFEYAAPEYAQPPRLNRLGFAHICFQVDDVPKMCKKVIEHGGSTIGGTVDINIKDAGRLTVVYMADPEGNIVELQRWH